MSPKNQRFVHQQWRKRHLVFAGRHRLQEKMLLKSLKSTWLFRSNNHQTNGDVYDCDMLWCLFYLNYDVSAYLHHIQTVINSLSISTPKHSCWSTSHHVEYKTHSKHSNGFKHQKNKLPNGIKLTTHIWQSVLQKQSPEKKKKNINNLRYFLPTWFFFFRCFSGQLTSPCLG